MTDRNAFDVLQELAKLTALSKEMEQNAENLRRPAQVYGAQSARTAAILRRPGDALKRVADALEEVTRSMEDFRTIVAEEAAVVKERLSKVDVKEQDLDEIHRRRQREAAEGEKAKERPRVSVSGGWTTGTSTTA
jgi:hypothetical protein